MVICSNAKLFSSSPRNSIKNAAQLKSGSTTTLDKSLNGYVNGIGFKAFSNRENVSLEAIQFTMKMKNRILKTKETCSRYHKTYNSR